MSQNNENPQSHILLLKTDPNNNNKELCTIILFCDIFQSKRKNKQTKTSCKQANQRKRTFFSLSIHEKNECIEKKVYHSV